MPGISADPNAVGQDAPTDTAREAARYRSLVEATAQIVWRTTADGGAVDGHEAWTAFTGVPVTPASDPADWFIPVHLDDRAGLREAWQAGLADGRTYEHPYRLRAADGSWRAMLVRAVPVRGPDGRVVEWVGTHTDVTEREAVRAALERERALLAEAQRIGRLGSWTWDMAGGASWVSEQVLRMFGVRAHELPALGASVLAAFRALLAPGERGTFDANLARIYAERLTSSSDRWHAIRPDGRALVVDAHTEWRYDAAGQPAFAAGTIQDVTEQAAADAALRASEERFRLAARATHDVLYEWDLESGTIWASELLLDQFGLPPGTVIDHAWWQSALHPDDRARILASLDATFAGSADVAGVEYRLRRGDGTWASVVDRAFLERDASGRPRRMIGALRDVSDQRELEAQLRQAQKMEAVGQLAGGVAHDFNNLLSVILASAELSRAGAAPGSVLAADLDEIVRAAQRGARLTRQLLAFSRRQVMRPRLIDLAEVVRGAESLLRRLLTESVALDLALPEAPCPACEVYADPGQVEQVLMNLVVNARDALSAASRPGGGTVQVAVDTVRVGAEGAPDAPGPMPAGVYVRVRVRDDGVGLDAATRARVFEPFFTTKPPGQGTGLGLSTAYGIAAQSGGTMLAEGAPGEGATFTLLLPAASGGGRRSPEAERASPGAAAGASAGTVLLVEDEAAVRRIARRLLERHGFRVLEARHGADALLTWDEHRGAVDVLGTDLRMPEMGGPELIERLRARRPDLPVVLMSGYVRENGAGAGQAVRALDKPFTPEELLGAVEAVRAAG